MILSLDNRVIVENMGGCQSLGVLWRTSDYAYSGSPAGSVCDYVLQNLFRPAPVWKGITPFVALQHGVGANDSVMGCL